MITHPLCQKLRPYLPRIYGVVGSFLFTAVPLWIQSGNFREAVAAGITIAGSFLGYAVTHRAFSARLNPVDAAKPETALLSKIAPSGAPASALPEPPAVAVTRPVADEVAPFVAREMTAFPPEAAGREEDAI